MLASDQKNDACLPLSSVVSQADFRCELSIAHQAMHEAGRPYSVFFVNLDGFRVINESFGHGVGDSLLSEIGSRLRAVFRPEDTVAHFGADEFAILAQGMSTLPEIDSLAQRVQQAVGRPCTISDGQYTFSASLGVVRAASHYSEPEELLRDASVALSQARAMGRARHQVFDAAAHAASCPIVGLERDLHAAIANSELELFYQPVVSLTTRAMRGFEALLRWRRPGHGLVPPLSFVPVAERNGLIIPIGRWVVRQAARQLRAWKDQFPEMDLSMAVNVSSQQVSQSDLARDVESTLDEFSLDGRHLELEITESAVFANAVAAKDVMDQLRQLGVRLSIDDFGTGYASLSQLFTCSFDTLKIDRLFVEQIGECDDKSLLFVEAMVRLARQLDMTVIAEGIESAQQLILLEQLGCDLGQGYYFSAPTPAEDIADMLQNASVAIDRAVGV